MDFDVNATSVKKGYGDYLKTLEIELQRGSQRHQHFNRKRSQSKRSGGGGGGHQRNLTGNFQPLNITPVNNDGGELYAPFSLLKQTVNNLEAYGLRPRSKAPLNMYGTTVVASTNSTIDGRPQ
jgi:hypothetical protein